MRIVDYTSDVRDLLTASIEAVDRIQPQFQVSRKDPSEYLERSSIDLVLLASEIYQLRRFARLGAPHIEDFGGFGTGLDDSDAPIVISVAEGKETWDFRPWLAEKIQSAEKLLFWIIDFCSSDTDSKSKPEWRRLGSPEDVGAECSSLLDGIREYLSTIRRLTDSGELKIRQLSADDSEE